MMTFPNPSQTTSLHGSIYDALTESINALELRQKVPPAPRHSSSVRNAEISLPELPLEVMELILTFLQGDHATLRSCSLACRVFSLHARAMLFESIVISDGSTVRKLVKLFRGSPGIPELVRILKVLQDVESAWLAMPDPGYDKLVSEVLGRLTNVQRVLLTSRDRFTGVAWSSIPAQVKEPLLSILNRDAVKSIRLDLASGPRRGTKSWTISGSIPAKVRSLSLVVPRKVEATPSSPPLPFSESFPIAYLKTFRLTLPDRARSSVESFASTTSILSPSSTTSFIPYTLRAVKRLGFYSHPTTWTPGRGRHEIESINRVMKEVSGTVEEVLIIPSPSILHCTPRRSPLYVSFSPSFLPSLETVHVVLYLEGNLYDQDMNMFTWGSSLFHHPQISERPLFKKLIITVDIRIYVANLKFRSRNGWDLLDEGIYEAFFEPSSTSEERKDGLEEVKLVVGFGSWEDVDKGIYVREEVRKKMWRLNGKGVLRIGWRTAIDTTRDVWDEFA